MNRAEFQRLAEVRLREAEVLLAAGLWDGAYYLAGYAVECGLKACILGRVEREGVLFEDKRFSEKCWTHSLKELVEQAGLKPLLDAALGQSPPFAVKWQVAAKWTEASRYVWNAEADARELVGALTDPSDGVMQWVRAHW